MSEMKPMAWCLITADGQIINGVHEEERLAAQYHYRMGGDTLTPLYTADQLADAVAAEREKNATYLNAFWAAASLDGEEVVVTIKLRALFIMDEKVKDTIRRVLNGSAAK